MKMVAYPSADVVGPAYYKQRASTMMDAFISVFRKQVKLEKAYADITVKRNLDFVHMTTGLMGTEAKVKMDADKQTASDLKAKLSIN